MRDGGFRTNVFTVEAEARGFLRSSAYNIMKQMASSRKSRARTIDGRAAERSSNLIWFRRKKPRAIRNKVVIQSTVLESYKSVVNALVESVGEIKDKRKKRRSERKKCRETCN